LKVLGIDPGITATGYGFLMADEGCNPPGRDVNYGTIRPRAKGIYNRILDICDQIQDLIDQNRPDLAVLEKVFYQKNIQSLIRSSELRGAIILTLYHAHVKIAEYAPAQIKLTTTGNGRASKEQVRYFIEKAVMHIDKGVSNHAVDAIAIAYTAVRKMHTADRILREQR
jgi:crossover junction endodeoxyribonuclease RuvC